MAAALAKSEPSPIPPLPARDEGRDPGSDVVSQARPIRDDDSLVALFADAIAQLQPMVLTLLDGPGAAPPAELDLPSLRDRLAAVVRGMGARGVWEYRAPEALEALRYALVALIDEWLIVRVLWPGRAPWTAEPLEAHLYGTRCAGRGVFTRMTALGQGHTGDPVRQQLATVYLLTMKLGFSGEWVGDAQRLSAYEAALQCWLAGDTGDAHAFPAAYAYCTSRPQGARIAPLVRFWRACGVVALGYLALSVVTWWALVSPLLAVWRLGLP